MTSVVEVKMRPDTHKEADGLLARPNKRRRARAAGPEGEANYDYDKPGGRAAEQSAHDQAVGG